MNLYVCITDNNNFPKSTEHENDYFISYPDYTSMPEHFG
jgi:hypothetical protein